MLTIEFSEAYEEIELGELFNQLDFPSTVEANDIDGDSFMKDMWGIEVLSADTYYPIEGYRWTKFEPMVRLSHRTTQAFVLEDCIPTFDCSPDHVILTKKRGWQKVKDLSCGDVIVTMQGFRIVCDVERLEKAERLCDLQVSIAHSYFAENVLSHNSHFLVQMGANAMSQGKNVLHYTFELSEILTALRYDSNLCDISFNDVHERKEEIFEKYKNSKFGNLIIKEYPPNFATINTIRAHIEKLSLKGFVPDLLIIDYADIMRSTRQYDSLRHELKLIYEELRGLAAEQKFPIWTASQTNREASQSDAPGLESMSEAYGKAMVADVVISLSRKAAEKSTGFGRLFIAKNRAGRDGLVYPIKIDTSKSMFTITGEVATPDDVGRENEASMKKTLREKLAELNNEGRIKMSNVTQSQFVKHDPEKEE